MKNWFKKNKDTILCASAIAVLVFAMSTDEPIPEAVEPTETESSIIQWKEPSIEPSTNEVVAEPKESETATETETEVDTSTEEETEIVEETEPEEVTYYCKWMDRHFTEEEFALICTTVFCESGSRTSKEQTMVALTILNQINSGKFGDSVREVIYRKNNFAVTKWDNFENRGWSERVERNVLKAFEKNEHPSDMYYFRTGHYHNWEHAEDYMKVGKIYFSTDK